MKKFKLKKGDNVVVISGKDKGKSGEIIEVLKSIDKVKVRGVNIVKKHNKPNANNPKGGITEKELPIHVSNISLVTSDGKPTRVGYRVEKDKKVRFSKKSGEEI